MSQGYYIRPAQPVGAEKRFQLDEYERMSYYYIKASKFGTHRDPTSFFKMLSKPELKRKFESKIDYKTWEESSEFEMGFIPLITDQHKTE